MAGPMRPQDRVALSACRQEFAERLMNTFKKEDEANKRARLEGSELSIGHGDVVIAAITSCTNTSNPYVMLGAGLVAQKAVKRGLKVQPWVKTSLAPGSQVVTDYLAKAGSTRRSTSSASTSCRLWLHHLHRQFRAVARSGGQGRHRGRSGRGGGDFRQPQFRGPRASRRCAPTISPRRMLVVAYALAGSINMDLTKEPIGYDKKNKPVYLNDIWPSPKEIADAVRKAVKPAMFRKRYGDVFTGDANWRKVKVDQGQDLSAGTSARPM